jgi:hypothetical protein
MLNAEDWSEFTGVPEKESNKKMASVEPSRLLLAELREQGENRKNPG